MQTASLALRSSSKNIDSFRRENHFRRELAVIDLKESRVAAFARFYGSGPTAYCVAWVWPRGHVDTGLGMGKAGGYGYHKESAALAAALADSGVALSEPIDGQGDGAMMDAMSALGRALTDNPFYVHHSHG